MDLSKTELTRILTHFPKKVSHEIVDYVTNVVLKDSRYVFTSRKGKRQFGYCTHCKKTFETMSWKHNTIVNCPSCSSTCLVKASGLGRKYMQDRAYFVWYEKSLNNPDAITARGIEVYRDYSGDYKKVETQFTVTAMYVFKPGESVMIDRYFWNSSWKRRKSIISESSTSMQNVRCFYSRESIKKAVKDTPFQYSTWEQYDFKDMLKFFDLAAKYPCIEYLTKLGLSDLVYAKLLGSKTYGAINWRGKTLEKVLRLTKPEIKQLLTLNTRFNFYLLWLYQKSRKDGSYLSFQEINELEKLTESHNEDALKELQKYTSLRKILRYIQKQWSRKNKKTYSWSGQVITTWKDYLHDCLELGMDVTDEKILFPTNLHKAHLDTIKKVEIKVDQQLNINIKKRVKDLKKLSFKHDVYFIRPATSSNELLDEGNALSHCVGGYTEDYAKGKTNILVLRKVTEPDKPFYTVEVKQGKITQAYGFENDLPTKRVQAFLDVFMAKKLSKNRRKVAV